MLGVVLAPYGKIPGAFPSGIVYSYGGQGQYEEPFDPGWNTRGEAWFYHDTQLGAATGLTFWQRLKLKRYYKSLDKQRAANRVSSPFLGLGEIPTDAELSRAYNYTPVRSGWINTGTEARPGPWLPPDGFWPGGWPLPSSSLKPGITRDQRQMMAEQGLSGLHEATTDDVLETMQAHNDRVLALTIVSTTAVAVSALLTVFRTLKLIKQGKND